MHIDFTVTLGNILTIASIGFGFFKFYRPLAQRVWEHDIMWEKFAEDNGLSSIERVQHRNRTHRASAGAD
jgi:hypothetical protein